MQKDGTLSVPDVPVVPYITGDGVGAEVTPSMQSVVNAAVQKAYGGKRRIEWKEVLAGERAFNAKLWICMFVCVRSVGIKAFILR